MILCSSVFILIQLLRPVDAFLAPPSLRSLTTGDGVNHYVSLAGIQPPTHRNDITCNLSSRNDVIDNYKAAPEIDDGFGPLAFGVTDSLKVPDDARPSLIDTISNPRDAIAIALLVIGGCSVAFDNIRGVYDAGYEMAQRVSICLGSISALAVIFQLQAGYLIAARPRMGIIDDVALTTYAGLYSGAASWLALRTSSFCPTLLTSFDGILPFLAAGIFAYSLTAPAITLVEHFGERKEENMISTKMVQVSRILSPQPKQPTKIPTKLSETELFRTKGLLFIGLLGCVFVPACLAFAFEGQDWWIRVCKLHPKQNVLESTDALFALFATEASMIATRAANAGVAPYRKTVPAFAAVCLILTLVPCACSLFWLGGSNDISFFSFYTE